MITDLMLLIGMLVGTVRVPDILKPFVVSSVRVKVVVPVGPVGPAAPAFP